MSDTDFKKMKDYQTKSLDLAFKEMKFGESEEGTFSGYLAVFGNVDSYGDVIELGAFKQTLADWETKGFYPPMLEQHGGRGGQERTPVGKWLVMQEDEKGLYVEGKLFPTSRGKDLHIVLKESAKGSVGMSIGYSVVRYKVTNGWKPDASGCICVLKEIKLGEGSIVTYPANTEARITEAKQEEDMTIREAEKMLKEEYGLSATKSKEAISKLKDVFGSPREKLIEEEEKQEEAVPEVNSELSDWFEQKKQEFQKEADARLLQAKLDQLRKSIIS